VRKVAFATCLLLLLGTVAKAKTAVDKIKVSCQLDPNDPEGDTRLLANVLGTMSLQLATDDAATDAMTCLLKLWPTADGALAEEIPSAFLPVMEQNPRVFFSLMLRDPRLFRKWLDDLPESFTWFSDPPCPLDETREQLISILQHTQMKEAKVESAKQEVIKRLLSIRCRQVD
jgi:hypothetical protein